MVLHEYTVRTAGENDDIPVVGLRLGVETERIVSVRTIGVSTNSFSFLGGNGHGGASSAEQFSFYGFRFASWSPQPPSAIVRQAEERHRLVAGLKWGP